MASSGHIPLARARGGRVPGTGFRRAWLCGRKRTWLAFFAEIGERNLDDQIGCDRFQLLSQ